MSLLDEVRWFPHAPRLLVQARAEMPQKDGLCGGFVALAALRAAGFTVPDQEEAALAAGSVLLEGDVSADSGRPETESGRADFRLALPATRDPAAAGTSAAGVARAVERLSAGRLAVVPASGGWEVDAVEHLLRGLYRLDRVAVLANVATGLFGAQDTPERALEDYLHTGMPPLWMSRWRVGHFVVLGGMLVGSEGTLVSVVDTYPSLGDRGVHLQPVEHLAAALRREGAAPGGVLLVLPAEQAAVARRIVTGAWLRPDLWDNGSPPPG
ncbi:DUF6885 family protein [Amycolatopsis cihanbeyliensis]|uniref:Peptidase C39-like protein n=1 Tax=Amycolatopsis cihanbeyliensis TaxID=1128664 RepID=A0A542DDG8_AMYCI|nr:hypothetical protein [Amycolatopsis cihanbeyliensis]TQJ01103.1 hypothetical protein FB471_0768 [Amycolatopsis cihanbeyliensis]